MKITPVLDCASQTSRLNANVTGAKMGFQGLHRKPPENFEPLLQRGANPFM